MNYFERVMALNYAYDVSYGVFDHVTQEIIGNQNKQNKKPLSLVAFHETEEVSKESEMFKLIRQFSELKVYHYYGLSLTELLEYPRDIVLNIFDNCKDRIKEESNFVKNVELDK